MEMCIFHNTKSCNNCGECDTCELNKNKVCDNCGKCLQLEGYDVKAIKIDEVFEQADGATDAKLDVNVNLEDFSDFDNMEDDTFEELLVDSEEEYIDALDDENNWQYIDDLEEVKNLLDDTDNLNELGLEKYPGLIVINPNKLK
ncbi:hypothetical protein [Clostridium tunisiense]|uniref:hypothetical protein n=1 Tax=Clostridium tunisiense TaxID=219748 RepID=UPI000315802D|nr:hypothetical protein [Clostridium tunisiense]